MIKIVKYEEKYKDELMELIKEEGEEWEIYWKEPNASRYKKYFKNSITYLAIVDDKICGYSRSLKDTLFIYVCDLLVNEKYRGNNIGMKLMQCIKEDYPEHPLYIMSGNDEYYKKIGCKKEGSIYLF